MAARFHPYGRPQQQPQSPYGGASGPMGAQAMGAQAMPAMPAMPAMQAMQAMQAMPAMPAMPSMPAAASEWETHWTNEGRPYYYNRITQQSVWEMPPEVMMSMMMPMQMPTTPSKPADPARLTAALINGHPIRPGQPDCSFFVSSGLCKFGDKCKYNHPPEKAAIPPTGMVNGKYPIRPNKPVCQYWTSTGDCKYGDECSFNHPPDKCNPSGPLGNLTVEPYVPKGGAAALQAMTGASAGGSDELPVRAGVANCSFYMKTGQCKYGAGCKYNHPPNGSATSQAAPAVPGAGAAAYGLMPTMPGMEGLMADWQWDMSTMPADMQMQMLMMANAGMGAMPGMPGMASSAAPAASAAAPAPVVGMVEGPDGKHPVRPGASNCSFYMASGLCKFGEGCKFNHPPEKVAEPPAGLVNGKHPIRPNKSVCSYWIKSGDCKFGEACTYNHPPESANPAAGTLRIEPAQPPPATGT